VLHVRQWYLRQELGSALVVLTRPMMPRHLAPPSPPAFHHCLLSPAFREPSQCKALLPLSLFFPVWNAPVTPYVLGRLGCSRGGDRERVGGRALWRAGRQQRERAVGGKGRWRGKRLKTANGFVSRH
jgi:hypothetical protein